MTLPGGATLLYRISLILSATVESKLVVLYPVVEREEQGACMLLYWLGREPQVGSRLMTHTPPSNDGASAGAQEGRGVPFYRYEFLTEVGHRHIRAVTH